MSNNPGTSKAVPEELGKPLEETLTHLVDTSAPGTTSSTSGESCLKGKQGARGVERRDVTGDGSSRDEGKRQEFLNSGKVSGEYARIVGGRNEKIGVIAWMWAGEWPEETSLTKTARTI